MEISELHECEIELIIEALQYYKEYCPIKDYDINELIKKLGDTNEKDENIV